MVNIKAIITSALWISTTVPTLANAKTAPVPKEWLEWRTEVMESFTKPYSAPTITHHVYLDKVNDKAALQTSGPYPRFQKEACSDCAWEISRTAPAKLTVTTKKDGKKLVWDMGQHLALPGSKSLFLSGIPIDNQIRLFIHDMAAPNLQKKRVRTVADYNSEKVYEGTVQWLSSPKKTKIQRSDGTSKEVAVVGEVSFKAGGKTNKLSIFNFDDDSSYKDKPYTMFTFRDYSNGRKTYGAGRFLNFEFPKPMGQMKNGDKVSLNFNYAYNPPCAVSTGFHCPLPIDTITEDLSVGELYNKL